MPDRKEKKIDLSALFLSSNATEETEIFILFRRIFPKLSLRRPEAFVREYSDRPLPIDYDLILLDCRETDRPETQCMKPLSLLARTVPRLPVLLCYDRTLHAQLYRFIEAGVHHFFPVPWSRKSLREHLRPLLESVTLSRRLNRCLWELKKNRGNDETPPNGAAETCLRLQKKLQAEESFFRLKTEELERHANESANMAALLAQGESGGREEEILGRLRWAVSQIRENIESIKTYCDYREGGGISFNLNTVLENAANAVSALYRSRGIRLIYEIAHGVPAHIVGDPILLAEILIDLLELFGTPEGGEETLLKITADTPTKQSGKRTIRFRLRRSLPRERGTASAPILRNSPHLTEIQRKITEMHGRLETELEEGDFVVTFTLTVIQKERRSYRLPSKSWMHKEILLIDGTDAMAEALEEMLTYFHFHVVHTPNLQEAIAHLYRERFDMIFFREHHLEAFVQEASTLIRGAKLILVTDREETTDTSRQTAKIDAVLPLPFTQQKIFDTLLQLYAKENVENAREILEILKENLAFLLGGKTALYLGRRENARFTIQELLEGAGIRTLHSSEIRQAEKFLSGTDLIFVDDGFPAKEQSRILAFCHDRCANRPVFGLLEEETPEKRAEMHEAGIVNPITMPIDPESFYRLILDRMLERGSL